jgi:hypothetical protein
VAMPFIKSLHFISIYLLMISSIYSIAQDGAYDYASSNNEGKVCLVDKESNKITKYIYDNIEYIGDGLFVVEVAEKYGIIDYKGRTVEEVKYEAYDFYEHDSIQEKWSLKRADSAKYVRRYDHTWRAMSVGYGSAFIKNNAFIESLNTTSPPWSNPIPFFFIEFGGPSNHIDDYTISVKYFKPTTLSDSISATFTGYQVSLFTGANLLYVKDIDLPLSFGWSYGRMYYTSAGKTTLNPNFSLCLRLNPRFVYRRVVLNTIMEGSWDISKTRWKPDLPEKGYKNSFFCIQAGLAYLLFDYKSTYIRVYK